MEISQMEAKRLLEKEFEELNAFTGRPGMKKYAYAYAMRKNYNELVMRTITASFRERGLYREKNQGIVRNNWYVSDGREYADGLFEVLQEAINKYTFENRDWGKKKHKYNGNWKSPENSSIENIRTAMYWGMKRRSWQAYPVYNYYSDYFFLCTHQSFVFYDVKKCKMVRGDLTKVQHPVFGYIPDTKEMLKRVLEIQNVDIRKNILKQLKWDYTKYTEEADVQGDYKLLVIDFKEDDARTNRALRRVYLKMLNPSTGENHIEAVHPDCQTVADAINYRRYGSVRPTAVENQFFQRVPNWTPVQLS